MKDILFIIGSESDKKSIAPGIELMDEKGMSYDLKVYSAHRNLPELTEFLEKEQDNYKILITAAGLSAALPGVVASISHNRYRYSACSRSSCRNGCAFINTSAAKRYSMCNYGNRKTGCSKRSSSF